MRFMDFHRKLYTVNSGLMHYEGGCDVGGGMCEDCDYEIGAESDSRPTYYHVIGNAGVNESRISEVSPDDVDLSSFIIKKDLNERFWKNGRLNPIIRKRLLEIASDFCKFIELDKSDVDDVIVTGSIANYNWSEEYSDVDLHVLCSFKDFDVNEKLIKNFFDSMRREWNEIHGDIEIYGFGVELYVQDSDEEHASTGVYSLLRDDWIKEPDRREMASSKVNKSLIRHIVSKYTEKIDKLYELFNAENCDNGRAERINKLAESMIDDIRKRRKDSLSGGGKEITNGNIIYKSLRRMGYIDKLYDLKASSYNKINSLP